ncbi:sigma factor-like helix-turn-helix DNA-binding protein [Archangium gephyra]|uniref:sigma factor-like helix-turn-helix DNA-binding protein n=1 Tax=Archangium gephyra TaxID=48 RepID=UPI003B7CFE1D
MDPRLPAALHHGELAAGEARDDGRAAQAVLPDEAGGGPPARLGPGGERRAAGRAAGRPRGRRRRDGSTAAPGRGAARRHRLRRRVGPPRSGPRPALGRADRGRGARTAELTRWFHEKVRHFAHALHDERERYILEHRLLAEEPETLQTIGQHFRVSRERARQVEAGLIASMREYLHEHMPDFTWLGAEPASGLHAPA